MHEKYIQLQDGSIYGYNEILAARRDSAIVGPHVAADWFRSQGIENELTRAFPSAPPVTLGVTPVYLEDPVDETPVAPKRGGRKAAEPEPEPAPEVDMLADMDPAVRSLLDGTNSF